MTDDKKKTGLAYEDPFLQFNQMIENQIEKFYEDPEVEDAPLKVMTAILIAMTNDAHVLIPVEIPEEAAKLFDPDKIQVGDTITSDTELHYKLIHLTNQAGDVSMPVFTSPEKMEKAGAGGCSTISFFLDEYMKQILNMQDVKGIIINPGEKSFFMSKDVIAFVLAEFESKKSKPHVTGPGAAFKAPKDVPKGFSMVMSEFFANNFADVEKVWFTGLEDGMEESWLFVIKTDSKEPNKIFDRINTMLHLMGTPCPVDYMVGDEKPWPKAELLYEKKMMS